MDTPQVIADLAISCRRFVKSALEIELDGTPDTLPIVDHYLTMMREDAHRTDVVGMIVPAVGAYFGQVCRRVIEEGQWLCPAGQEEGDPGYSDWRLSCTAQPLGFNPLGIALECALGRDANDWGAHFELPKEYQGDAQKLFDKLGAGVRDDDYYRLSVRLEVLESLYLALKGASKPPPKDKPN